MFQRSVKKLISLEEEKYNEMSGPEMCLKLADDTEAALEAADFAAENENKRYGHAEAFAGIRRHLCI